MPITAIRPLWAVEGGQVVVEGEHFQVDPPAEVRVGGELARATRVAAQSISVTVPPGLEGGRTSVRVEGVSGETAYIDVAAPLATGLHMVDNPAFDGDGNLYVTFSGSRGQQPPISLFVVRPDGTREPFAADVPNPTSMAFDRGGALYVSSRFDGSVHRIEKDGAASVYATDLGVACGIAFGPDDALYVGDRSGSILRVAEGRAAQVASIPPSVAAFHLAFGPDRHLYVTAPTLAARDPIYRVSLDGGVEVFSDGFGRPQGMAFDDQGHLFVVDAVAGWSAVYRIRLDRRGPPELMIAGGDLIGLAFDPRGGLVLVSRDTAHRLSVPVRGLPLPSTA
ncbi:MAG: IPT/TIG domain-containing protein [Vicinamibacterales bacterium]